LKPSYFLDKEKKNIGIVKMSNETAFPPNLMPDEASPDWFNKADNAWQLTAATLVGLHSIPGLMILSGGGMKKKWAVNSAFMVLCAFACVMFCWVTWGYLMFFGSKFLLFWGKAIVALHQKYFLSNI
jgi:Amt family ammonium transporter